MSFLAELSQKLSAAETENQTLCLARHQTNAQISSVNEEMAALAQKLLSLQKLKEEQDAEQKELLSSIKDMRSLHATLSLLQPRVDWKNTTLELSPEEDIVMAVKAIEDGSFTSETATVSWETKHAPSARHPKAICEALRAAPRRRLTFNQLLRQMQLPTKGLHSLQNYLRELYKQGIVRVHQ